MNPIFIIILYISMFILVITVLPKTNKGVDGTGAFFGALFSSSLIPLFYIWMEYVSK